MLARREHADRWTEALLEIKAGDCDSFHSHTDYQEWRPIGIVTSAALGRHTGNSQALTYFRAASTGDLNVQFMSRFFTARRLAAEPYDPENQRLKG